MAITLDGTSGITFPSNSVQGDAGIGYGQTWNLFNTTTRAPSTTYTNTTSKPIIFMYSGASSGSGGTFQMTVSGTIIGGPSWGSSVASGICISIVIPPGATYRYTQGAYTNNIVISELR